MNIAILGSRGVPNRYGGFERLAERLSLGLVEKGHCVAVFCPHYRNRGQSRWGPVRLRYAYNPERNIGAAGNLVYDFDSLARAVCRCRYDILYMLGYTSSAPFLWLSRLHRRPVLVTNMDGLEWKRTKWSAPTRRYLRLAERLAVLQSDHLITDSKAIGDYLERRYGRKSHYLAYGADPLRDSDPGPLARFRLEPNNYFLLVARIEPENNVEVAVRAFANAALPKSLQMVVVGDPATRYGRLLQDRYRDPRIRFVGTVYDQGCLNALRFHSTLYVHGHSVGGTNPALLEAMACGTIVTAHDNRYNREVLGDTGFFFSHHIELARQMEIVSSSSHRFSQLATKAKRRVRQFYSWNKVIDRYHDFFESLNAQAPS